MAASGSNLWESLFNQTPPAAVTSQSQDFQTLPAWYQDYQKGILQYAASSLPTNPVLYQGNRLSDLSNPATAAQVQGSFSPQERQAFDQIGQMQGSQTGALNQAQSMTTGAAAPVTGDVGSYMSPYISNVTDRLATLAGRNLSENLLPQISDTFVNAGQMSGSRMGEFTSRALRDTQESLLGQQGSLLNTGYQGALAADQADKSRQLAAGQQTADIASTNNNINLTNTGALAAAGAQVSQKAQTSADLAYQDFQEQRDWPLRNIGALNSALRGTAVPTSSTGYSTNNNTAPTSLSPLAAAAATGTYALGMRRGGRVPVKRGRSPLAVAARRAA